MHRAAVLGLRVLADDRDQQSAIRVQLTAHQRTKAPKGPSAASTITALKAKERKLFDLHYQDKIDADSLAQEHQRVKTQMTTLENEDTANEVDRRRKDEAADKFDRIGASLAEVDFDRIWDEANPSERRILMEDLIDSVFVYPDQLTVQVAGAPPFLVTREEVGLTQGCKPVVSKARREPSRTDDWTRVHTVVPSSTNFTS